MQSSVALHTLGCKLNYSETSTIGNQFLQKGFYIVDFKDKADVYVLNTCTVTENAERECRQLIRRALRQNPDAFIIVTGCYAQLRPVEISKIDGVNAVLGSNEKFQLFSLIDNFKKQPNENGLSCIFVSPTDKLDQFGPAYSSEADTRTRAYFKIQDGCDYKCSFCTIPLARGTSRSMHPDDLISNFKKLLASGYKEIILTGVNVGDYGKLFNTNLYSILKRLVEIEGDFRIRISSIEPNLLSDEIIKLVANNEKLCDHFHIPLQSGSPNILRLMQRRYKVENYTNLIYKIRDRIKDAGIGVDVITGFPGETEADFLETYDLLRELPVSYLHVFTYSERPNTKAINLPDRIDISERRKRNDMLRILSEKKRNEFYKNIIGRTLRVLFENVNDDGNMKGFSSNYIRVTHQFNPDFINKFSDVIIKDIDNNICISELSETNKAIDLIAC